MTQQSVVSRKLREYRVLRGQQPQVQPEIYGTVRHTGDTDPISISLGRSKQKPNCTVLRSELRG